MITLLLILAGCSTTPPRNTQTTPAVAGNLPQAAWTGQRSHLLDSLYRQHQEWRGTPYLIGGQSKRGIDCSGFVQLTYQSRLGISLPRTTAQLAKIGQPVKRTQLQAGDLVFFKINGHTRHVGIYLDHHRFLHASKSSGVRISDLNNPYWRSTYWQSKRVLQNPSFAGSDTEAE